MKNLIAFLYLLAWVTVAHAQPVPGGNRAAVVANCGTASYTAGSSAPLTQDTSGLACGKEATSPSSIIVTSLDVSTVAGSAVNALTAGHAGKGGFIVTSNAAGVCINQVGAAGTATSGDTTCVAQNQPYYLAPSGNAVSVNSTGNPVTIAGYGYH